MDIYFRMSVLTSLQMESKRSPAFLGALTECVGAHVVEFSKIFEEMHRLQPGLDSLREVVTGLKAQEEAQRVSSVEGAVDDRRQHFCPFSSLILLYIYMYRKLSRQILPPSRRRGRSGKAPRTMSTDGHRAGAILRVRSR